MSIKPCIKPTVRPASNSAVSGGGGEAPADPLVFHAFDDVDATFSADVIVGTGTVTEGRTSTIYAPDDSNVFQAFGSGVPAKTYAGGKWWVQAQPALTNSQIQSNDLTNAEWTASNMTVAKDATGLQGDANGACTLTATAGNATVIANPITASSGTHSTRWFLKRKTGTGTVELTLDNGSTWIDITTALDAASGWYQEPEEQAALTNPQIGIRVVTSGDAVYVGNAECHTAKAAAQVRGSGPIFTSGSAVSTTATDLSFDDANHDDTQGGWYAEYYNLGADFSVASHRNSLLAMGGSALLMYAGSNKYQTYDGVNVAGGPVSGINGTVGEFPCALAYGESSMRFNIDGSWGTAGSYDGEFNNTQSKIVVLGNAAGVNTTPVPSLIRNIRRYDQSYTDAQTTIDGLMA